METKIWERERMKALKLLCSWKPSGSVIFLSIRRNLTSRRRCKRCEPLTLWLGVLFVSLPLCFKLRLHKICMKHFVSLPLCVIVIMIRIIRYGSMENVGDAALKQFQLVDIQTSEGLTNQFYQCFNTVPWRLSFPFSWKF